MSACLPARPGNPVRAVTVKVAHVVSDTVLKCIERFKCDVRIARCLDSAGPQGGVLAEQRISGLCKPRSSPPGFLNRLGDREAWRYDIHSSQQFPVSICLVP